MMQFMDYVSYDITVQFKVMVVKPEGNNHLKRINVNGRILLK
jgi:hypothetical protein